MNKSSILSLAEWADRKLADKDSTINTLRTEKVMAVKEVKKQAKDKIENTEKEANKKLLKSRRKTPLSILSLPRLTRRTP